MARSRMLLGDAALVLVLAGCVLFQAYQRDRAPRKVQIAHPGTQEVVSPTAPASAAGSPTSAAATPRKRAATALDASDSGGGDALTIHVVGAVRRPGVYSLPAKARLADAVRAAGGVKSSADLESVNLAGPLRDGEQIRVPSLSERHALQRAASARGRGAVRTAAPSRPVRSTARYPLTASRVNTAATAVQAPSSDGLVNVNTATAEELDTLPGVGPATAAAILEFRRQHGPFQSVEDLLEVRGIGEKKLERMRDRVVAW